MSAITINQPLVSILLPVFNGGKDFLPAVKSIIDQTYCSWELIIIDDGSTDGGLEQIIELNHPQIRIVQNKKNEGLAVVLNQAIHLAQGQYIARMDADDLSYPDRLERQVAFLEANSDIDLLATRAILFDGINYEPLGMLPWNEFHSAIVENPSAGIKMPHPTWMGKATWFRENLYAIPEVVRAEDQELLLRTMLKSKFHTIPEVLLAYRRATPAFQKRFKARVSLLNAQIKFFYRNHWLLDILKAIGYFLLKVCFDIIGLIGSSRLILHPSVQQQLGKNELTRFSNAIKSK